MPDPGIIWPEAGRYILAVSGGADSMVLLDAFARAAVPLGYHLTVAHFDHGIRADSAADSEFVAAAAARHGLPFEHHSAALGQASEAEARAARHAWLEGTRERLGAEAILTAHHQDDLLETSLLNLARGSGRLGLAPMQARATIRRPLLRLSRADLREYASEHQISWREDPTNANIGNPRNLLRHNLLPHAASAWRHSYLELIDNLAKLNTKIDQSISITLTQARVDTQTYSLPIEFVRDIDIAELEELILAAARALRPGLALDRRLVLQAAGFARTGRPGKFRQLRQGVVLLIESKYITLTTKAPD